MTRLLASEVRRLASRRMLLWMLLGSVGLVVTIVVIVTARSDTTSLNPNDTMNTTDLWLSHSAAAARGVTVNNVIPTFSVLTYLLVIVLGASAVGAEYRAGTVSTVLTWEPRRVRLLVARLTAAAIVGMLLFVVVHAVLVGGWALGAMLNGRTEGADSQFWRELILVLGRATVLAGVLAVLSGAIATVGRNTAAAMGIWFGYLVAVEGIARSQIHSVIPWFVTINASAFFAWERMSQNAQSVSAGAATFHLAVLLVVIAGGALALFVRRDVT